MKDYAIIYNPTAAAGKSKKDFEIMEQTLKDKGISYKLFQTQRFGHAIELAKQCAKDGFRVIGAGGDGTCNEILNGVIYSNTDALVGFVPMGSGNDIPGAIGVKPDVKRACQVIAEENIQKHDVGMATTQSLEKPRYFLGIGSQGFDAKVTKVTNAEEKNLTGTWNYVKNVIKLVFSFKKRKVRVVMDDETFEGPCNLVAVGNGPSYGGGMYMCPYAKTNDQTFHISIIQMGTFQLLYNFNKMYSRTLQPHPGALEFTSKNVSIGMINPDDTPYLAQVDGEIIGNIPVEYEFLPGGYEFICPEENEMEKYFDKNYGKKFQKHCQKYNLSKDTIITEKS